MAQCNRAIAVARFPCALTFECDCSYANDQCDWSGSVCNVAERGKCVDSSGLILCCQSLGNRGNRECLGNRFPVPSSTNLLSPVSTYPNVCLEIPRGGVAGSEWMHCHGCSSGKFEIGPGFATFDVFSIGKSDIHRGFSLRTRFADSTSTDNKRTHEVDQEFSR